MTRINTGIHPSELFDRHLLAEHREIKRIPNCIKSGRYSLNDIPPTFRLGAGHVKFFYTRLKYLHKRYELIKEECINRGFAITDYSDCFKGLPKELYNDYSETSADRVLLLARIKERSLDKNFKKTEY